MQFSKIVYFFLLLAFTSNIFSKVGFFNRNIENLNQTSVNKKIKTWKDLRDEGIEKRHLDVSCGVASVATIFRHFYNEEIFEEDALNYIIDNGKRRSSVATFKDLINVVSHYGYASRGYNLSYNHLKNLKIPVLVHLFIDGQDHFSVLRGIGDDGMVWLANSSLGNRQFIKYQFEKMWLQSANTRGKILLIVPKDKTNLLVDNKYFAKSTFNPTLLSHITKFRVLNIA